MPSEACENRFINNTAAVTAVAVPILLFGASVYASWAIVAQVAVGYLLENNTELSITKRPEECIGLIIGYFILLILWYLPYFRMLITFATNPGLIELGPEDATCLSNTNGVEEFYAKEAFVCMTWDQIKPRWCDNCCNWKPDRTHHCSEINRCVRKMDHFCPWVGGVIGETTYKFFLQFLFYAFLYCVYILVVVSVLMAKRQRKVGGVNAHWIALVVLSGLFAFFLGGMMGTHSVQVFRNLSTIEQLNYKTVVHNVALKKTHGLGHVIVQTNPGENLWDLGHVRNWKSVMGEKWYDWVLPLRHSPCVNHVPDKGEFEFGVVLRRLQAEAGILVVPEALAKSG